MSVREKLAKALEATLGLDGEPVDAALNFSELGGDLLVR